MVLGRVKGICSDDIGAQLGQVRDIPLAAISIRQRVHVFAVSARRVVARVFPCVNQSVHSLQIFGRKPHASHTLVGDTTNKAGREVSFLYILQFRVSRMLTIPCHCSSRKISIPIQTESVSFRNLSEELALKRTFFSIEGRSAARALPSKAEPAATASDSFMMEEIDVSVLLVVLVDSVDYQQSIRQINLIYRRSVQLYENEWSRQRTDTM